MLPAVACLAGLAVLTGAACLPVIDENALRRTPSYTYEQSGDCAGVAGLPTAGTDASRPFGYCEDSSFSFGVAQFRFDDARGNGSWSQNPGCPVRPLAGEVVCRDDAAYRIAFDCNGCRGTITVGRP